MKHSSQIIVEQIVDREKAIRQPGSVLFSQARYEIVRPLGEGGMGITCLANEISAGNVRRPLVLKFLKNSQDPSRLSQFLNEVQLSTYFNHPNLLPIYRLETENIVLDSEKTSALGRRRYVHTVYYAVMQYIDGWNLRQIVDRLLKLKIILHHDITMFIISRIARGLHYVHEFQDENGEHLGLAHRDLSPENVLVDKFGRIKVADFGIALATKRPKGEGFLHAGNLLYCAPEQLLGQALDRRCDIYNIGLLMYFLFTDTDRFGVEARQKHNPRDRIRRLMSKSPLPDLPHVHPRLAEICDLCLRENPKERYRSCEDLANDIDMHFRENQTVVNNEQLEEILNDVFSADPKFVSRRYIPLGGSAVLEQPDFDPGILERMPMDGSPMETVRFDEDDT